jgi:hypothetical protein
MAGRRFRRCVASAAAAVLAAAGTASASVQLKGNERGEVIALGQFLDRDTRPLLAAARAPGGSFGRASEVARPSVSFPTVAIGEGGHAVAAWSRHSETSATDRIFVAFREPGRPFGAPVQLRRGTQLGTPVVAINARGEAVVLWGEAGTLAASFRPAGGAFSSPETLPLPGFSYHVTIDGGGTALAVWATGEGETARVVSSVRRPGGGWEPATRVSPEEDGPATPRALDGEGDGRALTVWVAGAGPAKGSLRAGMREADAGFAPAQTVAGEEPDLVPRRVALGAGGRTAVLWTSGRGDPKAVRVALREPGAAFAAPVTLAEVAESDAAFVRTDLDMNDAGDAAAVWQGERVRGVHASYRPRNAAFGQALALHSPSGVARGQNDVSVTVDGGGGAIAGWEQSNGERVSEVARRFDARGAGGSEVIMSGRTYVREGSRRRCFPRRSRTLAGNRQARVYAIRGGGETSIDGCLFARGAPVELADGIETFMFPRPALHVAGPLVGHAAIGCDPEDCETLVFVTDLRDELTGVNVVESVRPFDGYPQVGSLRIRRSGAIAWISCPGENSPDASLCPRRGQEARVYKLDAGATEPTLLATGRRIDTRSLGLRGSTLSWIEGIRRRTARLR